LDYAPYVKLPDPGLSVQASGNQICVAGLDHGKRYSLTFRAGLPAASGEVLRKAVEMTQYVRDRSAQVRFPGRAYVLPKASRAAIPVDTVNVKTIDLTLRRISGRNILRAIQRDYFGRAIAPYDRQTVSDQIGAEVWSGQADVAMVANKDVLTRLPLDEVMAKLPVGVYALDASVPGADPYRTPPATQWFVISDLGLTSLSGVDGLHVTVRSLSTTKALPGLTVTLLSQANAVLGTAITDAAGNADFPAGLTQGTSGAAPGLVTVAEPGKDFGFLSLSDPPFDLSDRGVAGHEPAPPVDVFVTTDRGAYRAGEVVHVTALTRDGKGASIDGLPLTARLTRPDGVEYSRSVAQDAGAGGHSFDLPIAASAPRGPWKLDIYADPKAAPLATAHFLVADFLPERIDFALSLPDAPIRLGDAPDLSIAAKYLFGAPGADLAVEGEVKLSGVDVMDAYPGFRFGRYDAPFSTKVKPLPSGLRTDARGDLTLSAALPSVPDPGRPLQVTAVVRVSEGSGRPVERQITRALAPSAPVIGIKPGFKEVAAENAPARFDLIAVGPDGKRTGMKVHWVLNRVETRYQWYQSYGDWKWMPMTTRSRVSQGDATLEATGTASVSAPVEWGEYELKVTGDAGGYAASSVDFYAGWYAPPAGSATPDTLQMSLDKPSYTPGDTAMLRVVPRAAGTAMISVLSNRLISRQVTEVKAGDNVIPVKVTKDWGAGAYVTVAVVRPMDEAAGRNPARALGLAYAKVDPGDRQLQASIVTAPEAAPRGPMDVAVKVAGVKPGETAHATIAAVDVGILNLTGFTAPDPSDHYFGQRKLGVGIRDVYGRLIDGLNGAMGTVRSGGDASMGARMQSPPPTEKLVAFYSGVVTVGADGMAHAQFDLPAFNGTVRVMAVVWSKTGVGQASTDVLVRDPVVVTASLPRFLAPGDQSRLLLEIVHAKGPTGHVALSVSAPGLTLDPVPDGVDLTQHGKKTISIPIRANSAGTEPIEVDLTLPDGTRLTKRLILPVEVLDPAVTRTSRFRLAAGTDFTLSADAFAGLIPGTGQATLTVGPIARFDAPALLASLNRYPYGCTEQITSKALPLLYFADVAKAMGLGTTADLDKRVREAITAVLLNQSSSGSFGLWSPGSGDLWLDAYVTDFLSRARAQGTTVPQTAFRMALDNLRNQINAAPDFRRDGGPYAYALMVLAREGAAAMGDLRYYADARAGAFDTPLAAAQLGAALASYGDRTRAAKMFAQADRLMQAEIARGGSAGLRGDYGTYRRDAAAVLALAAEAGTPLAERASLEATVAKAAGSGEMTTQEETWTLLATHALIDRAGAAGFTVNGAPIAGPLVRVLDDRTAGDRTLDIHNGSDAAADLTVTTYGVPETPGPAGGNGYAIKRSYFGLDGRPADIASVKEGTRLVTVLEVMPFRKGGARLMVQDPLPAGFEIDNPNLLSSGSLRNFDWLKTDPDVAHTEFRQDRFLAAVTHSGTDPFRLAYVVRAITPGSYRHPAASVADMYRPGDRAQGATGTVTVTP
ncbi:MAG: alpha-2-macroglobulin family protein, partial [Paracoccaceae bacterium]|nr:alpha-2-macroglobulin family protein [Paracoccaceae bacterium]